MRQKGKIRSWNDQKGFGFIESASGSKDVFLHISALNNRGRRPEVGQVITFDVGVDRQGRPRASNVALPGDSKSSKQQGSDTTIPLLVVGCFFLVLAAAIAAGKLPSMFLWVYFFFSVATFAMYGLDKSAARGGRWRTSEQTLHILAFLGGWPGALIAQSWFRHKSKKSSFRAAFWVTVIFNILVVMWISTVQLNIGGESWIRPA